MITRRFDIIDKAVSVAQSLIVEGGVSGSQDYCGDTGEYSPDYTLVPLVLTPSIVATKDTQNLGSVNAKLANITWTEQIGFNSAEQTLMSGSAVCDIVPSGSQNSGRLTYRRNADPQAPITLRFSADLVMGRETRKVRLSHCIRCKSSTAALTIAIDIAEQTLYNPLRSGKDRTVHAWLYANNQQVQAANRLFVWEVQRAGGAWEQLGSSTLDYFAEISPDTASCTLDLSLMGDRQDLRVRAKYDKDGNPSTAALSDSSPTKMFSIIRRIPKITADFTTADPSEGDISIRPTALLMDSKGTIPNPEKELRVAWYACANASSTSRPNTKIGEGLNPELPLTLAGQNGMIVGMEVEDMGPLCAWVDSDGAILTDGGKILLIK